MMADGARSRAARTALRRGANLMIYELAALATTAPSGGYLARTQAEAPGPAATSAASA